MQSAYLSVIFLFKHKKLPFLAVLAWFLFLVKSKMANIVGDVTGLQQCHHPWNIPYLVKKIKEGKIVSKYCNISKTLGRSSIHPPPPPTPCTTVGVWTCVYVRGLTHASESCYVNCPNNSKETSVEFDWPIPIELKSWQNYHFCSYFSDELRRLSTESYVNSSNPLVTKWTWYWQHESGFWRMYDKDDTVIKRGGYIFFGFWIITPLVAARNR